MYLLLRTKQKQMDSWFLKYRFPFRLETNSIHGLCTAELCRKRMCSNMYGIGSNIWRRIT